MSKRLYITTAIDYVNSAPHIGTAYEKIGADVLARFHRLCGWEVHLQMGNDEHSVNVAKAAQEKGLTPMAYCDQMETTFRTVWQHMNIAYDGFIRTTNRSHQEAVRTLFTAICERKAPDGSPNIYKGHYTGWYCESCEAFYTEKDLTNTLCPLHNKPARWVEEENYFFALSKYRDALRKHLRRHPDFILPAIRRNEILRLLEGGLQDISMSREGGTWGIHLPIDERHTIYVWFDALINYITAIGYGQDQKHFRRWWRDATVVHVIGKDITRFHCVIWPAMLLAAGLPLPTTIFGHGFVYHRGERMSKTLDNVVDPLALAQQFGADPLRYFLLRENSFGSDGNFTWDQFVGRYNGDLANGLGNLVSRTAGMVHQYLGGHVPPLSATAKKRAKDLLARTTACAARLEQALRLDGDDINFHDALAAIWEVVAAADKFINDHAPWKLHKAGATKDVATILTGIVETVYHLLPLLFPFLPHTAETIWGQMGFTSVAGPLATLRQLTLPQRKQPLQLVPPAPLFPRIEKDRPATTLAVQPHQPTKDIPMEQELISIEDFARIDLRVATIRSAERIEGADRLFRLQVDLGQEQRQLVAGIAQHYTPEDLIGKQVCVVANLKPAKLRGVESHGMLLAASANDTVSILTPLRPVPSGTKVK